jgi:hypothetical protein
MREPYDDLRDRIAEEDELQRIEIGTLDRETAAVEHLIAEGRIELEDSLPKLTQATLWMLNRGAIFYAIWHIVRAASARNKAAGVEAKTREILNGLFLAGVRTGFMLCSKRCPEVGQ